LKRAPARILIIAGSDSSGGAGLQADIKTATVLGVYASTAVTAVTVQDTTCLHGIHEIPSFILREQIARVLGDIGADAIKIGMLGTAAIAEAVAEVLERSARNIPIVLDPVLASTSGTPLLEENAISVLKKRLFPITALLTPNIPEAETLAGMAIRATDDMVHAGEKIRALGPTAVLVKGGHSSGAMIDDVLVGALGEWIFSSPRIDSPNKHGTGCALSTAIACGLAQGMTLADSVSRAREFVQQAIRTAPDFGHGHGPLNHMHLQKKGCHPRESGDPEA
jgi:hydroxymethylpyrimidine/phosphomethylpyrimidine kinase